MPAKQTVIEQFGVRSLALPECIARGLTAYDRVKYYCALLQTAQAHAQSPEHPVSNLRTQRESSGVTDAGLDRVVEESVSRGNGTAYIPEACAILEAIFDSLRYMAAAIELAGGLRAEVRERSALYRRRLDALAATVQGCKDDHITASTIGMLTWQTPNGHDTVHQLAMDMHGELQRVQATIAAETIDGARAYGVSDDDRVLLRAFMAGIHETAGLKFGHPGLETTSAGNGTRLSIQNDLGSTLGHLIMIDVENVAVTLRYSDVHQSRLRFFQSLLEGYPVTWTSTSTSLSDGGPLVMSVGEYVAKTPADVERFLRFVGSRLVFLIDWNRARKRLSRLVSTRDAIDLLRWAADNNVGHRGFLEAGDIALIETAFERAFPLQTRFGVLLDELLGGEPARQFLMSVFRTASWGLATGRSRQLIEDQVEAELLRYLERPERHVLAGAAEHAATLVTMADAVRLHLAERKSPTEAGPAEPDGTRPSALTHAVNSRAETVLRDERRFIDAHDTARHLKPLFTEASKVASALEEASFLLPLIPTSLDVTLLAPLETLANQVGATARAYLRCLEAGQLLSRVSDRLDIDNFLITVDRLNTISRDAKGAQRTITELLLRGGTDCREFYALTTIAEDLESAASTLSRCGAIVRDEVLRVQLVR